MTFKEGMGGGGVFFVLLEVMLNVFLIDNVSLESLSVLWVLYYKMFLGLCPSC